MNIDTDADYIVERVKRAEPATDGESGWTLYFECGTCIWCADAECKVEPRPGEEARLYGKGFGYAVRGIAISGRTYRYLTEEQEETRHAEWCADLKARQEREAFQHRAEIAAGRHSPVAFALKESARADYEKGLANNTDPYGRSCYLYAADWAALMERGIAEGERVADIAQAASREADKRHGVTGFMHGVAVSILAHCWEHGEDLRIWHNLDSQVGTEGEKANESGGVLNPALLAIG